MTQEEDQNLAVEIHRGHRKAMEQLVRLHKDRLFTYARYMIRLEEEAKDIIQEAFMKAYTALTVQYDEPKCRTLAIRAWLFRIVRHIALNKIRSSQRRQKTVESMVQQQPDIKTSDTGYNRSMDNHLAGALENLGPEDRELVTLRFIDDLSYAEIVSVVGMTESAIRGKIYRALRKLRKMMEEK
jgi:RNA polymerase sigma-70 factor (ECF subfamily)